MRVHVSRSPEAAGAVAARRVAEELRESVARRGRALCALSGGATPLPMFRALAKEIVPWEAVHVFQVDERVAPRGDPARNLTRLRECLVEAGPLRLHRLHAMPVENADVSLAAHAYARELEELAGRPPVLDVIHLGLGTDGHTASLFPGDPALSVSDRSVAVAGEHAGRRRITLTLPVLNEARCVVWLVAGGDKAEVLQALLEGTLDAPAGRVAPERATVFADAAAAPPGS